MTGKEAWALITEVYKGAGLSPGVKAWEEVPFDQQLAWDRFTSILGKSKTTAAPYEVLERRLTVAQELAEEYRVQCEAAQIIAERYSSAWRDQCRKTQTAERKTQTAETEARQRQEAALKVRLTRPTSIGGAKMYVHFPLSMDEADALALRYPDASGTVAFETSEDRYRFERRLESDEDIIALCRPRLPWQRRRIA